MNKYLLVASGGAIGALLRYLLSGMIYSVMNENFPWGTLFVNLTGCFIIGVLWALAERTVMPAWMHPLVFTGLLGGFTTFSTYGLETFNLLRIGDYRLGLANLLGSAVLGLGMVVAGFLLVQIAANLIKTGSLS